jgi:hypothetical protein
VLPTRLRAAQRLRAPSAESLFEAVLRLVPAALFALAGLAFLLPGATVPVSACVASHPVSFTGAQLVTHSVPSPGPYAGACTNDPTPWLHTTWPVIATVVLIATTLGFLLAVSGGTLGPVCWATVGLLALFFAAALASGLNSPDVVPHRGYWLGMAALGSAIAWYVARGLRARGSDEPGPDADAENDTPGAAIANGCSGCGATRACACRRERGDADVVAECGVTRSPRTLIRCGRSTSSSTAPPTGGR